MKSSSSARYALVILALLVFLRPTTSRAATGDLDTTFGTDGMVTTDFDSRRDQGRSVAIQSDGKILVAGEANNDSNSDFALTRYDSDGELDTTFGGGDGMVTTDFGLYDAASSVAVQSDGKIVVAGYAHNGSDSDFALARYTSEGLLDTTFSGDGLVTTDFGTGEDEAQSVAVQSDGKILVAGCAYNGSDYDFALARYNSDGELDTTFGGGDGMVITDFGSGNNIGYSVAIQSDGKIVLAGYTENISDYDFAVARYDSDGNLDTTFGSEEEMGGVFGSGKELEGAFVATGWMITDFGSGDDVGYSIVIDDEDRILIAGYAFNGSSWDFALACYTSDGQLDDTFGTSGLVTTIFGYTYALGASVALQSDGKILIAGYTATGLDEAFALARYDSDGEMDTTFGEDGLVTTIVDSGDAQGWSMAIQDDNMILVAGQVWNGFDEDFALARYVSTATPSLTTTAVTSVTASRATSGGTISSGGSLSVTARGVCWNTSGSPTTSDTCTSDGSGTGSFSSSLTGLNASTTYHVRAYATNSEGTAYGNETSFTTSLATTPTVTTTSVTNITSSSATSGGNVTDSGGTTITQRGVCWNTSGSPTTSATCTSNSTGTGSFTSNLVALSASTTYYVRAYATNSEGTAYGTEESFTTSQDSGTSPGTPSVETGTSGAITTTSATISGNVTAEGNATVTERGVCYTMVNSSEERCVSCSSNGSGSFSVELTSLEPATRYTVFAYAVNSFGTGQGATSTFTTPALYDHVIFFRNKYSGRAALMYFIGAVRQGYALSERAGLIWQPRGVVDFNDDNSPDTMWQNLETGQMVLVFMNSYLPGEIRGKGVYPEWIASVCGDFNGDSHRDAIWRHGETGQVVAQLFENLMPVEVQGTLGAGSQDWHLSTAGDFNSDGTDDLVFRNSENGRVGIVLLAGAVYDSLAFLPDVTNQAFSIVAALDMDLDGSTDLVWFNENSGDLYVEYLSGVEHLRYGYLTNVPPEWVPFGGASYQ